MGLISFIRNFNKPVDIPQAEKDAIMAKAVSDYDAEMEALDEWSNDPKNVIQDRSETSPSLGTIAASVAIGTAIGKRL